MMLVRYAPSMIIRVASGGTSSSTSAARWTAVLHVLCVPSGSQCYISKEQNTFIPTSDSDYVYDDGTTFGAALLTLAVL